MCDNLSLTPPYYCALSPIFKLAIHIYERRKRWKKEKFFLNCQVMLMAQAYLQFIILCLNFLSFVKKGNSDNQISVSTTDVIQASIDSAQWLLSIRSSGMHSGKYWPYWAHKKFTKVFGFAKINFHEFWSSKI